MEIWINLSKASRVFHRNLEVHRTKFFGPRYIYSTSAIAHRNQENLGVTVKNSILTAYESKVEEKIIKKDDYQHKIVQSLQKLDDELQDYSPPEETLWSRFMSKNSLQEKPRGLYLWGSVGCGKTFLMDLFFENCSITNHKKRVHFHRFMLDVHAEVHQIKLGKQKLKNSQQRNPIPTVAKLIASRYWLLCLDEFQVTDVVDAMILKQLFTHLFEDGVILVATSNRQPDDLYKSGLQRSAFLPFIPLLKSKCDVKCLDSHIDYRKMHLHTKKVYFISTNERDEYNLDTVFKVLALAEDDIVGPKSFNVNNRPVRLNKTCGRVADCDFWELCGQPLGADDYDKIGKLFHTVIIRNTPQMSLKLKSEMRRFITLIDMMYDNRVRVVLSALVPLDQLFKFDDEEGTDDNHHDENLVLIDDLGLKAKEGKNLSFMTGEDEIFATDRTISRITEMQSSQYWDSLEPTKATNDGKLLEKVST